MGGRRNSNANSLATNAAESITDLIKFVKLGQLYTIITILSLQLAQRSVDSMSHSHHWAIAPRAAFKLLVVRFCPLRWKSQLP